MSEHLSQFLFNSATALHLEIQKQDELSKIKMKIIDLTDEFIRNGENANLILEEFTKKALGMLIFCGVFKHEKSPRIRGFPRFFISTSYEFFLFVLNCPIRVFMQ